METFARLDAWVSQVGSHYMEAAAKSSRAQIRASRGEPGAQADTDSALDFGRRSGEPQMVLPCFADAALCMATLGEADAGRRVAELVDELVGQRTGPIEAGYWSTVLALALALTDQAARFAELDATGPSRWLVAARLVADGSYTEAADELRDIGGRPEEAFARMLAARALIRAGGRAAGEAQLRRATEFWVTVGARRCLHVADALIAWTA